jgi:hypothetical protein
VGTLCPLYLEISRFVSLSLPLSYFLNPSLCDKYATELIFMLKFLQVVGIEMNASAVSDAHRNAEINGIKNCRFVCAKVTFGFIPFDLVTRCNTN